jgi:hypothetical protein
MNVAVSRLSSASPALFSFLRMHSAIRVAMSWLVSFADEDAALSDRDAHRTYVQS